MNKQQIYDIYRESMGSVECPQELQQQIIMAMEKQCAERQTFFSFGKRMLCKKSAGCSNDIAVVMTVLCIMLFIIGGGGIVHAVELLISQGVIYETYMGNDKISKIWFHLADWNVKREQKKGDFSQWQQYYPEFYNQLEKQGALEVMLPHYDMGEYEWHQGLPFMGELAEGDVVLNAVFVKEDSQYLVTISKLQNATHTVFIHALSEHYIKEVNGIVYEVFRINQSQTYEEYCEIMEEEFGERFSYLEEKEYEEWKKRPVYLKTMVNGWNYTFALSEDIAVEAFLESIY